MNKIKNIALGLLLAPFVFIGCVEEQVDPAASAVATNVQEITFEAQSAPEQIVQVYANGEWAADYEADWLTVSPMSGRGNTDITITVTDNVENGAQAAPRSATIIFRGGSIEREGRLEVKQKGDTYLGSVEGTVTEISKLEEKSVAKIKDATAVAVATNGFLLYDGTTYMFAQKNNAEVNVGDKLFLNGAVAKFNGFPSFVVDEYSVTESTKINHPEATDLTAVVDSYAAEAISYVKVEGTVVGSAIKNIAGAPAKAVNFYAAPESLGMEAVSVHKVTLYAYHVGMSGGAHQLVVVSFEDNGADDSIGVPFPFKDDFVWLDPYIAAANEKLAAANQISDVVAEQSSSSDGAANIYTTLATNGCDVLGELRARGYVDLNPGQKTIYLQNGYLKFGKTDAQSGLTLPLMKFEGEKDIAVQFQWCAHITGSGNVDKTEMVVAIEGPGTVVTAAGTTGAKVSDPVASKQEKSQMFWQDVTVKINGATSGTFITIRPKDEQMGTVDNPKEGQFRYHLDNIKVIDVAELVPAHMEVTGVENNLITFEGSPEGPAVFEVLSDREFTVESNVNWLSFNLTNGPADIATEIQVTCEESSLSELRKGKITVKSGTSTYEIQVVQSAAGMELDPFISIAGGNSQNVTFDAGTFNLKVQSNIEYEFSSDASWVTVAAAPATKAMVDFSELVVTYEANALPEPRVAHIRVFNAKENVEAVFTLNQAAYESGVYFQEDFSWVAPWADAYGSADSVGDDNPSGKAPNVYTQASHLAYDGVGYANGGSGVEGHPSFLEEFANRGYVDINAGVESIYTQHYYLKIGKGSCHTGIKLPAIDFQGATEAMLTFDWSAHMTGAGNIDKLKLVVEIEGDGVCADSQAKISNLIAPNQEKGDLKWQNVKVLLVGVTNNTRIIIRPSLLDDSDGITQKRWYIDNIKVAKPQAEVLAAWDLTAEGNSTFSSTWNGLEVVTTDKTAGDGGKYIAANAGGNGKITYVQIDKTELDVNDKAARACGKDGEPYVIGAWPGDSWNLTAESAIAAGSIIGVSYYSRTSGTGMKYWLVEYLDGDTWKPALPIQTVEVEGQTISYNIEHMNTDNFEVNFVATTTADMSSFKVRQTCVVNAQASGKGPLAAPNGGTIRLKGADIAPKIVKY